MRKVRTWAVAAVAGLTLATVPAVAAQASPWEFAGSYATDAECQAAGQAGVSDGSWSDYVCALFEGVHDLYVR